MGTQSLLNVFGALFIADCLDLSLDHQFGMFKAMTGNRAMLTNFVEKFLGTVRFGNNDFFGDCRLWRCGYWINDNKESLLYGVDLLTGAHLSNLYTIDLNEVASNYLTCLLAKASSSQSWMWHLRLSHVKISTINNLVKNNLVQEFKNKTLAKFFDEVGITQQFSAARTPHQNGVMERRNRTLVEAARTMLTFANLPLFLLAEAIATTCFTQNHLIIHKRFDKTLSQVLETLKKDLEDLFQDFYDEYFDSSKVMKSSTTNVESSINEEVFHEVSESFQVESSSSSLNDDVQQIPREVILPQTNTQSNNMIPNVDEVSTSHNMFNERVEDAYFDASTSFHDPSKVHTFYQPYPHKKKWTKNHPLHKIIGDPKSSVRTRGQLVNSCLFSCLLSSIEPATVAEALRDADWVSAMQEELDQFARLKV
nr:hypothetical protein [Tanacetum cinerariifolium]